MPPFIVRLIRPLTNVSTWRRWTHLIMGGALAMPYVILGTVVAGLAGQSQANMLVWAAALVLSLPAMAATALSIPAIRTVESSAAIELLGQRATGLVTAGAHSWPARWRTAGWFVVHLLVGAVVSGLTLGMPPMAVVLLAEPVVHFERFVPRSWDTTFAPLAGVAILVGLVYVVAGAGTLLARLAPVLLGPSPTERLAELERQAGQLAERNRLARELHDSVGHALTTTTLQATAAGRVLDGDPEFARQALAAIEDAGRAALEDLDHVLGLLRDDASDREPQRTLTDLDGLLASSRSAGVSVEAELTGDVAGLAPVVSREAYRIVQEGLTNTLRHAGKVPVTLRLAVEPDRLELEMTNPIAAARERPAHSGGRGLHGMQERVAILRGHMTAAVDGDRWRVAVHLPLGRKP